MVAGSGTALIEMARYLSANPASQVLIAGHTDSTGDYGANIALSQARASAVVETLVSSHGIERRRLTAVGVGMASPLASNSNAEGRARNRRVEMVLR